MEIPVGVMGGAREKIQAMPIREDSFSSSLLRGKKKGPVKIAEEQAKLMESAEKSWFILGASPYFYNLPQLFFRQEWWVPIMLGGERHHQCR